MLTFLIYSLYRVCNMCCVDCFRTMSVDSINKYNSDTSKQRAINEQTKGQYYSTHKHRKKDHVVCMVHEA